MLKSALIAILESSPHLAELFERAPELGLDHYYFGAGCIVQTVWNRLYGCPPDQGIDDIDLVYYDTDLSQEGQNRVAEAARVLWSDVPYELDVINQARVHLWYESRFGYPIAPYPSLEASIRTWPTTATAVCVRKIDGRWDIFAPFGLDDLFGLIVRPNPDQITKSIYERKVERWSKIWPNLNIVSWDDAVGSGGLPTT